MIKLKFNHESIEIWYITYEAESTYWWCRNLFLSTQKNVIIYNCEEGEWTMDELTIGIQDKVS